jgi:DNA-binding response OmpR family regulator
MMTQGVEERESMRYAFDDCVLDAARRELRRAGEVARLEPKAHHVLVYLVQPVTRYNGFQFKSNPRRSRDCV